VLDRVVYASLRPALLFIAPLLFALGLFHWVLLPPSVVWKMVAVAETTALACVVLLVLLRRNAIPVSWSHRVAGAVAAAVLINSLAHLSLVNDPADTTNVLLFIVGVGFVLLSTRWLAFCLVVAWAGWLAIALTQQAASSWWRYTFALISATVLSAIVHVVRLRTVARLEVLRLDLEDRVQARTTELSNANERLVATNAALQTEIADRRATEAALANERNLLRTLVDNLPDAVYIKDVSGRYRAVNRAYLRLHDIDAPELLIGCTATGLQDSTLARREQAEDRQLTTTGGQVVNREDSVVRRQGERRHLLTSKSVARDASGAVVGLVAISRDVTAAKRQERMRELMDRKLRDTQKLESLGVLAGGIAHDFNNLLTAILGNASLMRMEDATPSDRERYVAQIESASSRAADLCRQMLAYAGRGHVSVQRLDMNAVVEDTLPLLQISISKKAHLKLDLASRVPAVSADLTQLRQVLMNLVINASDALSDGSGTIVVSTGMVQVDREYLANTVSSTDIAEGEYTFLEVRDDGCGMTRETLDRVFEPFFTTKFTGRGLGLSVVLGIVRGHRGALTIYSEPGLGSTFKLLLPTIGGPADAIAPRRLVEAQWHGAGELLVIDDEESVREVATSILTRLGYRVSIASNGAEGLAIFRRYPNCFAAVLLDLTMPELSGDETLRELRNLRPDLPVLLMSGFNEQDAATLFAGVDGTGFVQKPFTLDMLGEHLHAVLQKK
jgi:PAS domain S-box-containing protein